MLRRTLAVAVAALTLAVPTLQAGASAAPAPRAAATSILGAWKGKVYNQDGPARYNATVHLTRSGGRYHGSVDYSGPVGSTTWTYRDRDGAWVRFWETSKDARAQGVAIKVKRVGAKLVVRWRVPGSGYRGHMKAHRLR